MRRAFVGGVSLLLCLSFSAGCSKKESKPKPEVVVPAGDPPPPQPPGAAAEAPAAAGAALSDEVCARVTEHAAKIAGVPVETMNAPGEKGCGDITQPLADCILAATDVASLEACRPAGMQPR